MLPSYSSASNFGPISTTAPLPSRCCSHPSASLSISQELNEIDFGGAEGLPQPLASAYLAPTYLAWSEGRQDRRAGSVGDSGTALQQRAIAAIQELLDACDLGGQVKTLS